MSGELKKKVVRGFAWNVAERIASALFQLWVVVNVLNRLVPDDTALVAILAAFVLIFNTFVDSGFSQTLIRRRQPADVDFSSAFWFNAAMSAVVYALLVGLSYPAAEILNMPELVRLSPVFFLIVPLGALGIIQQTVLVREFDFRKISSIGFASTVGAGIIAVSLAFTGFGVWALVGQRVGLVAIKSILLWVFGRWKPRAEFSGAAIRGMAGYSLRLLATDFLANLYNSIPQFIIGHIHRGTLGNFDSARKVRDMPVNSAMLAMQSVTFPALAAIGEDDAKFARVAGRVVGAITFLIFPMMAGLIVVADEMFGVFLAPQWWDSVPFFRILCLAGFAMPLTVISSNILRTRSDGRAVLRAEIAKKVLATAILAATIPFGALPITWGVVGVAFTDTAVSFAAARRYGNYGAGALARDVLPVLALTVVMAGAVWGIGWLVAAWPMWLILAVKVLAGAGVYLGGAAALRLEGFREFAEVVRRMAGKIKSQGD